MRFRGFFTLIVALLLLTSFSFGQETPPTPGAPKSGQIPSVRDKKLVNGLTVAVGEKHGLPLVTIQLLVKSAAAEEDLAHAGLADMTASLLTKGTKTRNATQIAEAIEALGGSISSGAGWNSSTVTVAVTSDKLDQALAIMADVVLNPSFKQDELDLLRSQYLDGLTYNLKQPGFLATYVSSKYSFGEHPAGGTPESLKAIDRNDIVNFHKINYRPDNAVLIFAGDVNLVKASAAAQTFFGKWKGIKITPMVTSLGGSPSSPAKKTSPARILVIDLPNSGQAAVKYSRKLDAGITKCTLASCSSSDIYYPATVMNSILGGGYSSRLNQEIRIKRGLSYGAGSGFSWRETQSNFSTSTQTKTESAAEVAELVIKEIERLASESVTSTDMDPRKLSLTGDFGQALETTGGLAGQIANYYSFGMRPAAELNVYNSSVRGVKDSQIRSFADASLRGGDIVIVGDAKMFMDDLKKRFPTMMIMVIAADDLDLSKDSLRK